MTVGRRLRRFWRALGPGFVTGASDDDPSGIATYSQAGAQFGMRTLWTSLFSLPFMIAVQEMCGRIGMVQGKGLAHVIKERYGRGLLTFAVVLLVIANVVNIGADIGAMAASLQLLIGLSLNWWLIIIATFTLVLEIFVPYKRYARYLKYFAFSLFAYVITAIIVTKDWGNAFTSTILPDIAFSKEYLMVVVAILGTTISPYLFFWQASEEVEEEIAHHKLKNMDDGNPLVSDADVKSMRNDTFWGMLVSNAIMFFIMLTAATTLFPHGITEIKTAVDAAQALKPFAGQFAYLLFALGIVGTGLLAIPVLAGSASYAISESFGWAEGLYQKASRAPAFYLIIGAATLLGLFMNLMSSIEPFRMLYYAAILNGLIAPPLLFVILHITNDPKVMGTRTNSGMSNFLGYTLALVMSAAAIALIFF
jgi:NRAMP (natural resistance-associated macrophage protein)-like metal ion transporter